MCVCVCVCVYMHIYTYTCTHTDSHTHTHTHDVVALDNLPHDNHGACVCVIVCVDSTEVSLRTLPRRLIRSQSNKGNFSRSALSHLSRSLLSLPPPPLSLSGRRERKEGGREGEGGARKRRCEGWNLDRAREGTEGGRERKREEKERGGMKGERRGERERKRGRGREREMKREREGGRERETERDRERERERERCWVGI